MNADRIIVVDNGTILEQGTHESLISAGGKYSELWSKQVSISQVLPWDMAPSKHTLVVQTFIKPKAEKVSNGKARAQTKTAASKAMNSTEDDDAQPEQVKTPSGHKREV